MAPSLAPLHKVVCIYSDKSGGGNEKKEEEEGGG